ncbi:hypothetical protein BH11ACT1_BH11ACT1_17740 [soil metagenome]
MSEPATSNRAPASSKTTASKLLLKPGAALWVSDTATLDLVGSLPAGVTLVDEISSAAVAVLRAESRASVESLLDAHGDRLAVLPVLWVLYPKGNRADINRDSLWPLLVPHGLRPITQVSVDDVWSALRFRALKEGERQKGDHG